MNSSKNNLTSIISFVSLLLSQPRSMLAMIAAASWLIISLSFFLSQPDQNEKAALNDPNTLIAKFWHEYGWQYKGRQGLESVHFVDDQLGWTVGGNGTILATLDGGKNWSKQISNTWEGLNSVHFINGQLGWAAGGNRPENKGTILTTRNGGKNWSMQVSNNTAQFNSVYFFNNQLGWAVGENRLENKGTILTTRDGGKNWIAIHFVATELPNWYWFFSILCAVVFLLGLLGIRAPSRSDAISAMLSSDRPRRGNESDALESKKLAWALSRFLRHQRTEPPLTIAVNAPWGGGKSSLMNWLREDLERFGFRPIWFNAWHYEKQEQMFPALLETIRQQAIPTWLSWQGIKFRGWLLWHRIKEHPALTGLLFILACFPAGYFFTNHSTTWTPIKTQAVLKS